MGLKPVTPSNFLNPAEAPSFELTPLVPSSWDWFALDDVVYHGRRISIVWDRLGTRYRRGQGLTIFADGEKLASSTNLEPLTIKLPPLSRPTPTQRAEATVNFAVNNDGTYYPRIVASYSSPNTSISKLNDGNFWYMPHPPNRWTCEGSPNGKDSVVIDFGTKRPIHTIKLYPLDDAGENNSKVRTPQKIDLEAWVGNAWQSIVSKTDVYGKPQSHRANVVEFDMIEATKVRVTLHHPDNGKSGLSEIEVWGDVTLPLVPQAPPAGNLAYNPGPKNNGGEFPKASASHTSRFDRIETANDGVTTFLPNPPNRWTSYESKSATDWLEIDFGQVTEFRRVELAIYDDRGGVQAPASYVVQYRSGTEWIDVLNGKRIPEHPIGGQWNEVRFDAVKSSKVRIVFTHQGQSRSGVSEVLVWND